MASLPRVGGGVGGWRPRTSLHVRCSVEVPHYRRAVLHRRTLNVIKFPGRDGVIAIGRAAPKQVGAHGSPEGDDRAALLISGKVERRDASAAG